MAGRGAERRESNLREPERWLVDWVRGGATASGESVNETTAMRVSAVYACVRNIAEDIAKLPLHYYERVEPRGKRRLSSHRLQWLLHTEPNAEMDSFSFRQRLMGDALVGGNGYAEIQRDGSGGVIALWPIASGRVTPRRTHDGLFYDIDGGTLRGGQTLASRDMFHLKGFGDGFVGWCLTHLSRETIGLALAAEKTAASFFANGLKPSATLEAPEALSDVARNNLRAGIEKLHAGSTNAYRLLVLEEGLKISKWSVNPKEAEFNESRNFTIEDIARWFRIPPHKIGHLLRATFSNIESQAIEYVVDTLQPWAARWEGEIERKLISPRDRGKHFAEHVFAGLLRGDAAARSTFYREQFNVGAMSPNDIRELENRNPYDGGDVYFVNGALLPVEIAAKGPQEPATQPARQPDEGAPNDAAAKAMADAHKPSIRSVFDRLSRMEADRVLRLARGENYFARLDAFLAEHKRHVETALSPAAAALVHSACFAAGRPATPAETLQAALERYAAKHVADMRAEAEDVSLIARWPDGERAEHATEAAIAELLDALASEGTNP